MHRLVPLAEQGAIQQRATFASCAKQFADVYESLPPDPTDYVTPFWQEQLDEIGNDILPVPPWDFLQHKVIKWTMFVPGSSYTRPEVEGIGELFEPEEMLNLLAATPVGDESTMELWEGHEVSSNTIHHLYHLARYAQETSQPVAAQNIFEWGGGYGNMAKIYKRMWAYCTYVMVDTRLFAALQWLYLSSVFGRQNVVLHNEPGQDVLTAQINIVPIGLVDKLRYHADLFVSTWAISESAKPCQDLLMARGLYGAKRLLVGHQGTSKAFPWAGHLRKKMKGCKSVDIEFLPGNRYLFR